MFKNANLSNVILYNYYQVWTLNNIMNIYENFTLTNYDNVVHLAVLVAKMQIKITIKIFRLVAIRAYFE